MGRKLQPQHPEVPQDGRCQFAARDRAGRAKAIAAGAIQGDANLPAAMTLEIPALNLKVKFDGEIRLA